jgi:hypothetical protein
MKSVRDFGPILTKMGMYYQILVNLATVKFRENPFSDCRVVSCVRIDGKLCGLPSLKSSGYQCLFSRGVKRPRREADHSLSSGAEGGAVPPFLHMSSWGGA